MSVFYVHDVGKRIVTPLAPKGGVTATTPSYRAQPLQSSTSQESYLEHQTNFKESDSFPVDAYKKVAKSDAQDQAFNRQVSVSELMSRTLVSIDENASLSAALKLMDDQVIHHLIVVDDENYVLNLLSEDALLRQIASQGDSQGVSVRSVARATFHSVHPDTPVSEAGLFMLENGVSGLLVTQAGLVQGLVTHRDILKYLLKQHPFRTGA